jgi:hypothetical protein
MPPITAESLTSGTDPIVRSDELGAFRIDGLGTRDYELFAFDTVLLARVETPPIPAGRHDVEIRLGADAFVDRVSGRVVARDGAPIADAVVSVGLMITRDEGASSSINGTTVKTDEEGQFELVRVPRRFIHVDVGGESVLPREFALADIDLEQPLRLEVERRCHFRVEGLPKGGGVRILAASPTPGSSTPSTAFGGGLRWLGAYDADGNEMQLMSFQSGGWSSMNRQEVTTETTKVYAVGETAVELRLYERSYDQVAARRPLHLVPGQVTLVRW